MIDCVNPLRLHKNGESFFVRCNHCLLCRLRKRADWTLRIQNEASMYDFNTFATLTYNDDTKPDEINVRDFQLFMKRLRKDYKKRIRYFMSAEYGDTTFRPHYHLILFGFDPGDAGFIEDNWNKGFIQSSLLTPERANYCCGYVQKKLDYLNKNEGIVSLYHLLPNTTLDTRLYIQWISQFCKDSLSANLRDLSLSDSDINNLVRANKIVAERVPFCTMSRKPGLGYFWYQANKDLIAKHYFISWQGRRVPIPLYYKQLLYEDYSGYKEAMMKFFEDFDIQEKKKLLRAGFSWQDLEDEVYFQNLLFEQDKGSFCRDIVGETIASNGYLASVFDDDHKNRMRQKEIDLKKKNEIYLNKKRSFNNYVE